MTLRILFIGEALTLSHVVRPLVLARAAQADGHHVTFACDDRYAALVGPMPFRSITLRAAIAPSRARDLLKEGAPLFSPDAIEAQIREDRRLFRLVAPDLVVGDMRHSLAISARLARIPFATIINAHWCSRDADLLTPAQHPLRPILPEPFFSAMFRACFPLGSTLYNAPMNQVRLRHGLPLLPPDARAAFVDADHLLFPDPPGFPPLDPMPANATHLGPILWSPALALPEWWGRVPQDRPGIYVNLGSSGEPGLLPAIAAGLAGLGASVMLATTGGLPVAPRDDLFVTDFLPGEAAAPRIALAILSGGSMPVQPMLHAGVPVLSVPSNADQLAYARMVAREGAGEIVPESDLEAEAITAVASRMLSDRRYRDNARRLAIRLRARDAAQSFRDFLRAQRSRRAGAPIATGMA